MAEETKNKTFEKSTHQQKWLVEQLRYNLKNDEVLWHQGWITRGAPESAITGKKYRGANNFLLTIVAYKRGYRDNRWVTYNQIEEHSWKFKTDAEGKSLGKGAGVPVEFYSLHDRKTKKAFEKSTLFGMNEEEQQEYMKENVFPIRRSYYVFNGDLIDGMTEYEAVNGNSYTVDETWSDGKYYFYAEDELGNATSYMWIELSVALPEAQVIKDEENNRYRIVWSDDSTGKLNGVNYTKNAWITGEGE